ncbi:DNA repair protein RadC [Pantoea sp. 1B4]|uniref:DNA repair protein RadC n=2 Tax=Pantoea TaxID=53335 RepID=A0ACC5PVP6_ENTAG|nr:DNA repair protein RadC [Pantoea agglomerans]MBN1091077.1 DNA repair protein RadC [Pantoea sp. 1B4]VXC37677.1 DNA repair protein RadC [Pantoea brenneri]NEG87311.1 DNA repair protein RadC [Pantoea agglomerans]NEH09645.1 DNA repair protein RadC [Pantoea agglomerans]
MSQQNVNTTASESKESSLEIAGGNVSYFSSLHVRDTQGNYVMASVSQILTEAERAIDFRYPTGTVFTSAEESAEFFRAKLAGREREVFAVAFLNNQHQLIAYEELFMGGIASIEIQPREVARAALRLNAAAVIMSHNHPSFSKEPSRADEQITARLKKALELIAVRVIDHIVVAGNDAVSMAERGLI